MSPPLWATIASVTSLKLGFQLYSKMREIDRHPAREFPFPLPPRLVFKARHEINRIIDHPVPLSSLADDLEAPLASARVVRPKRVSGTRRTIKTDNFLRGTMSVSDGYLTCILSKAPQRAQRLASF
jgi:hypothetical protein